MNRSDRDKYHGGINNIRANGPKIPAANGQFYNTARGKSRVCMDITNLSQASKLVVVVATMHLNALSTMPYSCLAIPQANPPKNNKIWVPQIRTASSATRTPSQCFAPS